MDTPYVALLLVIFLVIAGLVVDVGYLYVDREELKSAADRGALAGVRSLHERYMAQLRHDPARLSDVLEDVSQPTARGAVRSAVLGSHESAALIGIGDGESSGAEGDVLIGRWEGGRFNPGITPVNAVQVTTHRTAEHSAVGMGNLGRIFARLVGIPDTGTTATSTAALRPFLRPGIAILADRIPSSCVYPSICTLSGITLSLDGNGGYSTPLTVAITSREAFAGFVCGREPRQDVCGKSISLHADHDGHITADLASLMYDPSIDAVHKETDPALDRVTGWWSLVPVVPANANGGMVTVTRCAMVRIARICAPQGVTGCGGRSPAYPSSCVSLPPSITIDRASLVDCDVQGSPFPGLDSVLVQ